MTNEQFRDLQGTIEGLLEDAGLKGVRLDMTVEVPYCGAPLRVKAQFTAEIRPEPKHE